MKRTILAAVFALSCSHTRPAELTAEEHRAEAAVHQEQARKEASKYDPGQTVRFPGRGPFVESPSDWTTTYNPTAEHLAAADREMRRASDHLAAARRLEVFESEACKDIAPAERSACPLLASWVDQVHNTRTGIELSLKTTVDGPDVHRRLDCHLAYAEANGFQKPSCPLFVKGMAIRLRGSSTLVMSGQTPEVAKALQDQALRIFAPEKLAPVPVSVNP